jgi:hypothetical protein
MFLHLLPGSPIGLSYACRTQLDFSKDVFHTGPCIAGLLIYVSLNYICMRKLQSYVRYFVFSDDLKSTLTLHDHRFLTNVTEASDYVEKLNSTTRQERAEQGWPPGLRFSCHESAWIKTRPRYLKAFRDYFGDLRIEVQNDPDGRPTGFRIQGIPPGVDLTKSDLGLIAGSADDPFTSGRINAIAKTVKRPKKPKLRIVS